MVTPGDGIYPGLNVRPCGGVSIGALVGTSVGVRPPPDIIPGTPVTIMGSSVGPGVGLPLTPGIGIQLGTWQHSGSLGSAVSVQEAGMFSYFAHLQYKTC